MAIDGLTVAIARDERALESLRDEWTALAQHAARTSIFVSHTYTRLAWKHFSTPTDRLWVIAIRQAGVLLALAPLRISRCVHGGIGARVVKFIAEWEGDRPGILCTGDPDQAWAIIVGEMLRRRDEWEVCELGELDAGAWPLVHARALDSCMVRVSADTLSHFVEPSSDWSQFLAARPPKARQNYQRRLKLLAHDHPNWQVEMVDTPDRLPEALERFVRVEQASWKGGARCGVSKDARHLAFYRDLLQTLVDQGLASVWFLRADERDIAARIRLRWRDAVFERHIAYDPRYARYSPGTLLRVETLRSLFGTECKEVDFLGMHTTEGSRQHVAQWATSERITYRWTVFNLRSRLAPVALALRVRDILSRWWQCTLPVQKRG